jgi:hypothetical protein
MLLWFDRLRAIRHGSVLYAMLVVRVYLVETCLTWSRASSIRVLTSDDTNGMISDSRFS